MRRSFDCDDNQNYSRVILEDDSCNTPCNIIESEMHDSAFKDRAHDNKGIRADLQCCSDSSMETHALAKV